MKKHLLWGAILLGSLFTAQAQGTDCATAEAIDATGGDFTVSTFEGAAQVGCWGTTATASDGGDLLGAWYSYTADASGYVTFTSVLDSNPGGTAATDIDTRVSVYTGTCGTLTCYNGNDDVATDDYRSTVTFAVEAGTTYYIVWENYWQELEFDFSVSFEGATCFYPSDISIETSNLTNTSFTVSWDAAIGNPASYDVRYGAEGFDPTTEGTTVNTTTTSANLTGLANGSSVDYYIRSICSADDSSDWEGPFSEVLAITLPYENSFDGDTPDLAGFRVNGFGYTTDTAQQQPAGTFSDTPEGFFFSSTAETGTTNSRLYIRPIYLAANEAVTLDFFATYLSLATATFEVTVGTSTAVADQAIIGEPFSIEGVGSVAYNEFLTTPYTAPAAGTYYFVIHNTSVADSGSVLLLDTLVIDSELGTQTLTGNKLSVYPNPSSDVVNIANAGLINSVKVTDLNGRTVKAASFDGVDAAQVSISDLASGVYMMTVASDKGTNTTKIVKN